MNLKTQRYETDAVTSKKRKSSKQSENSTSLSQLTGRFGFNFGYRSRHGGLITWDNDPFLQFKLYYSWSIVILILGLDSILHAAFFHANRTEFNELADYIMVDVCTYMRLFFSILIHTLDKLNPPLSADQQAEEEAEIESLSQSRSASKNSKSSDRSGSRAGSVAVGSKRSSGSRSASVFSDTNSNLVLRTRTQISRRGLVVLLCYFVVIFAGMMGHIVYFLTTRNHLVNQILCVGVFVFGACIDTFLFYRKRVVDQEELEFIDNKRDKMGRLHDSFGWISGAGAAGGPIGLDALLHRDIRMEESAEDLLFEPLNEEGYGEYDADGSSSSGSSSGGGSSLGVEGAEGEEAYEGSTSTPKEDGQEGSEEHQQEQRDPNATSLFPRKVKSEDDEVPHAEVAHRTSLPEAPDPTRGDEGLRRRPNTGKSEVEKSAVSVDGVEGSQESIHSKGSAPTGSVSSGKGSVSKGSRGSRSSKMSCYIDKEERIHFYEFYHFLDSRFALYIWGGLPFLILFILNDFPPFLQLIDAHACFHISAICMLIYLGKALDQLDSVFAERCYGLAVRKVHPEAARATGAASKSTIKTAQ